MDITLLDHPTVITPSSTRPEFSEAVCLNPKCGWWAGGRSSTVKAVAMDHSDNS